MNPKFIAERIEQSDAFRELDPSLRAKAAEIVQSMGTARTGQPGAPLIQAGHLGFSGGYFLIDGTATVLTSGEHRIDIVAPTLLGEMAQFKSSDRRNATVTATSEVIVLDFDWDDFYARAEAELGADGGVAVRAAIERLVSDRFNHPELLTLPLFRGLPDPVLRKVCMPFAWLADCKAYSDGARLFAPGERCQQTGILLTRGIVKLRIEATKQELQLSAPHLIGVMPKNDPSLLWTAEAIAVGEVVTYQFNWTAYLAQIQKRLSPGEQQQMIEAMKMNGKEHLWH